MFKLTITETATIAGVTAVSQISQEADGLVSRQVSLPAAKEGTLTTRTSTTVGTLTMANGHGITTGARLDIYFTGGIRRGVLVGTVTGNSVPFTVGAGEDLPALNAAVTAMVPQEEVFLITGNTVKGILFFAAQPGMIVIAETDNTEILAKSLGSPLTTAKRSFAWIPDRDPTNPVAGDAIAKVFFSHGAKTAAEMWAYVLVD